MTKIPTSKVPVLVTGGAGYIGSHAMLALADAGWPVTVIDDLSTGTRRIVPPEVPFYQGSVADSALVQRIFAEQGIRAIMHFAGSMRRVPVDRSSITATGQPASASASIAWLPI